MSIIRSLLTHFQNLQLNPDVLTDSQIKRFEDGSATEDDLQAVLDGMKKNMAEVFRNDKDFIKPFIDRGSKGAYESTEKKVADVFGLKPEEIAGANFEDVARKARELYTARVTEQVRQQHGTNANQEVARAQAELMEERRKVAHLESNVIPGMKEQHAAELRGLRIDGIIREAAKQHKTVVSHDALHPSLKQHILSRYDIVEENGVPVLMTKEGTRAMGKGTNYLELQDEIRGYFQSVNALEVSNGGARPGSASSTTPGGGAVVENVQTRPQGTIPGQQAPKGLQGMSKAEQNLAALQKNAGNKA